MIGSTARGSGERRARLSLAAVVAGLLALSFPVLSSDNTNRYLDQAIAIAVHGELNIDRYHENTIDKAFAGGHYYPVAPPGPTLLAVLPAFVGHWVYHAVLPASLRAKLGAKLAQSSDQARRNPTSDIDGAEFLFLNNMVSIFAMAPVAFLWLLGMRRLLALFADPSIGAPVPVTSLAALLLIGTHVAAYGVRLWSHVPAACALTWCFVYLAAGPAIRRERAVAAGALSACLPLIDYPGGLSAVVLGGFALWSLRRIRPLLWFAAGALGPALVFFLYHAALFGGPLTPAHASFVGEGNKTGLYGARLPTLLGYYHMLLSPERGLLMYAPMLLFGVVGGVWAMRNRATRSLGAAAFVLWFVQVTLMASYEFWHGGLAWGPRFLIPVVPALAAGLTVAWQRGYRKSVIALAGLGVLLNVTAVTQPFGSVDLMADAPALSLARGVLTHGFYLPFFHFLERATGINFATWPGQFLQITVALLILGCSFWPLWRDEGRTALASEPPARFGIDAGPA